MIDWAVQEVAVKKAVVFDLDGTLLNTLPDIAGAMNRALAAHGLSVHPEDAYRVFTGNGARMLTRRAVGLDDPVLVEQVFQTYAADYALHNRVDTVPYPGIPAALHALLDADFKVCVYSNKDDADVQPIIPHYFPDVAFAAIRGRMDGLPLKPDPTSVLQIADELQLSPQQFWYVGDTRTDMLCARNAGMTSVFVTWGFQQVEDLSSLTPDFAVDSASELVRLITA